MVNSVKLLPIVVIKGELASLLGRNWLHYIKLDWKSIFDECIKNVDFVVNENIELNKILNKYENVF